MQYLLKGFFFSKAMEGYGSGNAVSLQYLWSLDLYDQATKNQLVKNHYFNILRKPANSVSLMLLINKGFVVWSFSPEWFGV